MVLVGLLAADPGGGQALCVKHYAIAFDLAALDAACDAAEVGFLRYRSEQAFTRVLDQRSPHLSELGWRAARARPVTSRPVVRSARRGCRCLSAASASFVRRPAQRR